MKKNNEEWLLAPKPFKIEVKEVEMHMRG